MKTLRKTTIAALAGIGTLGLVAVGVGTPALSHGPGPSGPGYGPGFGMMGPGYGGMMGPGYRGMMGPGAGYGGMMGPGAGYGGMMGPGAGYGGMMGPGHHMGFGNGAGFGFGPCAQAASASGEEVGVDDVTARMDHWLSMQGNDRLKLGKVEAVDDDTITAEIVTVDGSLVQKLAIDRHTGWTRPAN